MDRKQFEMRHGFIAVFDTKRTPFKRRSIHPRLAEDQKYMDRMGFILIEAPELPPVFDAVSDPVIEPVKQKRKRKQK